MKKSGTNAKSTQQLASQRVMTTAQLKQVTAGNGTPPPGYAGTAYTDDGDT